MTGALMPARVNGALTISVSVVTPDPWASSSTAAYAPDAAGQVRAAVGRIEPPRRRADLRAVRAHEPTRRKPRAEVRAEQHILVGRDRKGQRCGAGPSRR
jgi:hypothetical protein